MSAGRVRATRCVMRSLPERLGDLEPTLGREVGKHEAEVNAASAGLDEAELSLGGERHVGAARLDAHVGAEGAEGLREGVVSLSLFGVLA